MPVPCQVSSKTDPNVGICLQEVCWVHTQVQHLVGNEACGAGQKEKLNCDEDATTTTGSSRSEVALPRYPELKPEGPHFMSPNGLVIGFKWVSLVKGNF